MAAMEDVRLPSGQERAALEHYVPHEWSTDPDFALGTNRHEGEPDWFSRVLGWLAAR